MGFVMAVASAGPYENNLHLTPDRKPHQHLNTQFTSRMLFLTTNQQCQSTDGTLARIVISVKKFNSLKYGVRSQVTLIK